MLSSFSSKPQLASGLQEFRDETGRILDLSSFKVVWVPGDSQEHRTKSFAKIFRLVILVLHTGVPECRCCSLGLHVVLFGTALLWDWLAKSSDNA